LEELQKLRPSKPRARVSVSEPEARRMRQSDGGIAPNYNVQIAADAAQSLIVDVKGIGPPFKPPQLSLPHPSRANHRSLLHHSPLRNPDIVAGAVLDHVHHFVGLADDVVRSLGVMRISRQPD
jgi:hypothetical protein